MATTTIGSSLSEAFNASQGSFSIHRKLVSELTKRSVEDAFTQEFITGIDHFLVTPKKRSASVERFVQFVVHFLQYEESSKETLAFSLLEHLLNQSGASDKTVRYRSCQLLAAVINGFGPEVALPDELWSKLSTAMCLHSKDKLAYVRLESVPTLQRLQNPDDESDNVTAELMRLLTTDSSPAIRASALKAIAITDTRSLPVILSRSQDSSPAVRTDLYKLLSRDVELRTLTPLQRVQVLSRGLNDRMPNVVTACKELLYKHWMAQLDNSVTKLLALLDVEENEEVAMTVAAVMLEQLSADKGNQQVLKLRQSIIRNLSNLSPASALLWHATCIYLKEEDIVDNVTMVEHLKAVHLEIATFTKAFDLESQDALGSKTFVQSQLLKVCRFLDFQDEVGRRELVTCLLEQLRTSETTTTLIADMMLVLQDCHVDESDFIRLCAEILSDVDDEVEILVKSTETTSDEEIQDEMLERLEEVEAALEVMEEENAMGEEYYKLRVEASELERKLENPVIRAKLKYFEVLKGLLKSTNVSGSFDNPIIKGLDSAILGAISSEIPAIRELGIQCYGLYSILDKSNTQNFSLLWKVAISTEEDSEVRVAAIKASCDLACIYTTGISTFENDLLRLMEEEDDDNISLLATEVCVKLFMSGKMHYESLFQKLVLIYFSKDSASSSDRIIQVLSIFFQAYVGSSNAAKKVVQNSIWPLILNILYENCNADLATVCELLLHLVANDKLFHENLASDILIEIIIASSIKTKTSLCKILSLVESPRAESLIKNDLTFLSIEAEKVVSPKNGKFLKRFSEEGDTIISPEREAELVEKIEARRKMMKRVKRVVKKKVLDVDDYDSEEDSMSSLSSAPSSPNY